MKQKDEQIERGRKLHRLMSPHPDFEPLLKEWDERIQDAQTKMDVWTPAQGSEMLAAAKVELKALKDLREWVFEEIETGGRLFAEQQRAKEKQ